MLVNKLSVETQRRLSRFVEQAEFEEFMTALQRQADKLMAEMASNIFENPSKVVSAGVGGITPADDDLLRRAALLRHSVDVIRDLVKQPEWIASITL